MEDKSQTGNNDVKENLSGPSEQDKKIHEEIMQNVSEPPPSIVRQRQQTCTFKSVKSEDLPTYAKNFKPARRMTLQQMIVKDQKDESLIKYKKALLGDVNEEEIKQQQATEVEFVKIEIVCKDRPEGNIILDFSDASKNEKTTFVIKEGSVYFMRVFFKVKYDIVYGLKFVNNVWRHFIKVDKYEEMMGCFAPKQQLQSIDLQAEEAPTGILGRGNYKGKIMFLDNDGIVHMQFDYTCKIAKKWTD